MLLEQLLGVGLYTEVGTNDRAQGRAAPSGFGPAPSPLARNSPTA